jgi:hypothetical protein
MKLMNTKLSLAGLIFGILGTTATAQLEIMARDDKPAGANGVRVNVDFKDGTGAVLSTTNMSWANNDNGWRYQSPGPIPAGTVFVRLTFVGDTGDPTPDTDRNAFIDHLLWNGAILDGTSYDADGGTDPSFPGSSDQTVDGRRCAGLGNNNDWAEYRLTLAGMPSGWGQAFAFQGSTVQPYLSPSYARPGKSWSPEGSTAGHAPGGYILLVHQLCYFGGGPQTLFGELLVHGAQFTVLFGVHDGTTGRVRTNIPNIPALIGRDYHAQAVISAHRVSSSRTVSAETSDSPDSLPTRRRTHHRCGVTASYGLWLRLCIRAPTIGE